MDLIAAASDANITLSLFLTGTGQTGRIEHGQLPNRTFAGRIGESDLMRAIDGHCEHASPGKAHRDGTLCYVCGPSAMTDEFVSFLSGCEGMSEERVLCEKWW